MLIASLDSLQLPTTSHLEKSSYGQLYLDLLYRHLNYFYSDSHRRRLHFETKSGYYSTLCFFVQGISPIGFSSSVCVKYFRYVCMIFVKISDILFFISQKFRAFCPSNSKQLHHNSIFSWYSCPYFSKKKLHPVSSPHWKAPTYTLR